MFNRDVHLGGWNHELEPLTGFTYATEVNGQWLLAEPPRLAGPCFAPPDRHFMRDPSLAASWPETGGTPLISSSSFRSLVRPWSGTG